MKRSVIVIGLGRFGTAAARELMRLGNEVLAIDIDERRVNELAPEVTHAVELDASDEAALRSMGAGDFEDAVVAISGATEASIFATMALKTLGVTNIVAKAATSLHGAILERVGADRVIYAEREMGERVAHVLTLPHVLDYLDIAPSFGIVRFRPTEAFVGRTLGELDLPGRHGLTPVALRRGDRVTVNPPRDSVLAATDELTLLGPDDRLQDLEG